MQNSQIQDLFPVRLSPIKDKIQGFPPFYTKPEINHGQRKNINISLRKKCQYSEFFWSVFSRIWTEYGEIRSISSCSVRIWENTDQKKLRIWTLFTHWRFLSLVYTVMVISNKLYKL